MNTDTTKKVAVALSGGLDSSVTCALLIEQGYQVIGITAKMVDSPAFEEICTNAKKVADKLGIKHYVLNLSKEFKEKVIDYFENSYKNGTTPNPCVMCNKHIKWGKIFDYAINELNCDYIATGHYAKIVPKDGKFLLFPAKDEKKDQLYYLVGLSQKHLSKTLFPLSDFTKEEIKEIAQRLDLPSKSAKESQDICFIQKPMTTKKWLLEKFGEKKGDFILQKTGEKVGQHSGHFQYTTGQRKGIGIAFCVPLYATCIDGEKNTVYVGTKDELYQDFCEIENPIFHDDLPSDCQVVAKIRYNMPLFDATVCQEKNILKLQFSTPQSAVTKGQICAIYDKQDGHLIAGGEIR